VKHGIVLIGISVALLAGCQTQQHSTPVFTKIHTVSIHVKDHEVHDAVYSFLKDDLQLPVVYTPLTHRERKYAGLWAGNLVLEPCGPFANTTYATADFTAMFYGITFESYESSMSSSAELDNRRIEHEPPYAFVIISDPNLCGQNLIVSIMDNQDRNEEKQKHAALTSQLNANRGGPLGIQYVEEIQVGCTGEQNFRKWKTLLAPVRKIGRNSWQPQEGPAIHLVKTDLKEIKAVVFKVASLESAVSYLRANGMLGERTKNSATLKTPNQWEFTIVLQE